MQNEVRYREYAATGQLVEEVHLDDIIRLYINHGPAAAVSGRQLDWALQTLTAQAGHHGLARSELLRALRASGEQDTGSSRRSLSCPCLRVWAGPVSLCRCWDDGRELEGGL